MRKLINIGILMFVMLFVPFIVFGQDEAGTSDTVVNETAPPTFEILEQVKLNFKDKMIEKGFFFEFPKNDFTFVIKPQGIKYPTLVDAKKISVKGMTFPEKMFLVGERIYEYEIYDPMAFNHKIALEFVLRGNDFTDASLYYWDFTQSAWMKFPNQEIVDGELHGYAYATKLRLAVFKDDWQNWGEASWYKYKECDCAASPFYPKGTKLLVTHLYNNKQVVVTVNDFGPERDIFPNRVIDLDYVAFEKIANPRAGVIDVSVKLVVDVGDGFMPSLQVEDDFVPPSDSVDPIIENEKQSPQE